MKTPTTQKTASKEIQKNLLHLIESVAKELLIAGSILLISGVVVSVLWLSSTQANVLLKKTVLYIQSRPTQTHLQKKPRSPEAISSTGCSRRPAGDFFIRDFDAWIALFSFAASFGLVLEAKKWSDESGDTTVFIRTIR